MHYLFPWYSYPRFSVACILFAVINALLDIRDDVVEMKNEKIIKKYKFTPGMIYFYLIWSIIPIMNIVSFGLMAFYIIKRFFLPKKYSIHRAIKSTIDFMTTPIVPRFKKK